MPSGMRRVTAKISASVMSAVSSATTPGVLLIRMPRLRRMHVKVIDTGPVACDQLELAAECGGLRQHVGVDAVGHRRHQHVEIAHRLKQLIMVKLLVLGVQRDVEKLGHAGLNLGRQLSGHENFEADGV